MSVLAAPAMLHPKQSREGGQHFWRSIHSEKLSEQHCAGGAGAPEQSPREKGRAGVLFPGAEALVGSSESFKSPRSIKDQPELGLEHVCSPCTCALGAQGRGFLMGSWGTPVGLCGAWEAAGERCCPVCLGWMRWLLSMASEGSHTGRMCGFVREAPPARHILETRSRLCSGILCHCLLLWEGAQPQPQPSRLDA